MQQTIKKIAITIAIFLVAFMISTLAYNFNKYLRYIIQALVIGFGTSWCFSIWGIKDDAEEKIKEKYKNKKIKNSKK